MTKIAAYITAYEDKNALKNCLESIRKQTKNIDKIFIADNSNSCIANQSELIDDIQIQHFPDNIGISGGLNIVLHWAIENKFDFLWTFDQDSEPESDTLEKLILQYEILSGQGNKIGIIGPLPVDIVTGQKWHGIVFDKYRFKEFSHVELPDDYYKCDAIITSGSLINLHIAQQVPFPRKDLFIDAVDWDYCMNFRRFGYEIILAKNTILKHRFGNAEEAKSIFKKRKISIYHYSPLRYYYMCRNHTFIETRLAGLTNHLVFSIFRRIKFSIILSAKIIIYEKEMRWIKLWACLSGTFDGFRGKLGKSWQ